MNQGTTKAYDEFVFRRLTEPISVFGLDLPPKVWLFVLIAVLIVGVIYVGIMYIRDSRGVGILWAGLLGMLRLGVYAAIAFVFLLPAKQNWTETTASSKVVVVFDVSQSMGIRDDLPAEGVPYDKMPTRSDKLLNFIQDSRVDFFGRLTQKNPVSLYRIASGLDPNAIYYDMDGRTWSKEEYTEYEEQLKLKKGTPQQAGPPEKRPLADSHLKYFVIPNTDPNAKPIDTPADVSKNDEKRFAELIARNKMLAGRRFYSATNLGDATLNTLTRELNNMVQGIVIFTDGRSTEGSDDAFAKIADSAKKANIPIFVVGIGEVRPQVKLEITDLRAPQQVQPEDKWPVVLEVTGEGLAEKELVPPPEVHITYTRKKDNGQIERLKLYLVEKEDKKTPKKPGDKPDKPGDKPGDKVDTRDRIYLSEEIILRPDAPVKFDASNPPRLEVEFAVDAKTLAKANNPPIDLDTDPRYRGRKWVIGETVDKSDIHLQAFVAKNKLELTPLKIHKSDFVDVRVLKKPLRVLLFASAATHDFQFLNNMLLREVQKQRAQLSVYVQPPPGIRDTEEYYKSIVLGVDADHLLRRFPDKYDSAGEAAEKFYDLSNYDAIVAFDPDWTKLSDEQLKVLNKWANAGGGIIMVGGPINTLQLARPGINREKLKPVLELLPVVLRDVRIDAMDRKTEYPWPLYFEDKVAKDLEFLKLTEEGDPNYTNYHQGWNEFFYGNKEGTPPKKRGFFNFYPCDSVKQGALIVARFTDNSEPKSTQMKDGTQMPYIVVSGPGVSRVVWLAWGETRRLRQHSEAFYERFWIKLLRYAGSNSQTNLVKRVRLDMSRSFIAGKYVQLDAKISAKGGEALFVRDHDDKRMPYITLKLPAGVDDIPLTYKFVPRKVKDDNDKGKFSLRFRVKSPGDYQLALKVPETNDTVIQKFNVKESNPELDDTRPDFDQMYRLASDAEQVLARIPVEADREEVKRHLVPPVLTKDDSKMDKDDAVQTGKPRLYFSLKDAELIPLCMKTVTDTKQVRGKYEDIWDESWTHWNFHVFGREMHLDWLFNALMLIVGLLSMEWLIRKLIRLA